MSRKQKAKWKRRERRKALPRFCLYAPQAQAMITMLRRLNMQASTWEDTLAFGCRTIPNFCSTTDCHILLNEIWWRDQGMPCIAFEDPELIRMMYNARLDIVPDAIRVPGLFAFCFPRGIVLDDIKIEGCLFGCLDVKAARDYALSKIEEVTGEPCDVKSDAGRDKAFFLTTMTREGNMPCYLRTWFRKDDAVHICDDEWIKANLTNDAWMIDREYKQQRVYFKLVYALCVYMQAFPDCIQERPPSGVFVNPLPRGFDRKSMRTVKLTSRIARHPSAHYRRWHFRTLHDSRFRRNPDGSVRVVFVRDTVVGVKQGKQFG